LGVYEEQLLTGQKPAKAGAKAAGTKRKPARPKKR
jgi:hypothetical protein